MVVQVFMMYCSVGQYALNYVISMSFYETIFNSFYYDYLCFFSILQLTIYGVLCEEITKCENSADNVTQNIRRKHRKY